MDILKLGSKRRTRFRNYILATAVFYGGSLTTVLLFFYLALSWSKLLKSWHAIDRTMGATYGYPENLDMQIQVLTVVFLILAIGE